MTLYFPKGPRFGGGPCLFTFRFPLRRIDCTESPGSAYYGYGKGSVYAIICPSGDIAPLLGHVAGCGVRILPAKSALRRSAPRAGGLRCRGDDRRLGVEPAAARYRLGGHGPLVLPSGGGRFLAGGAVPAAAGATAAGGCYRPFHHHDPSGGDAAQHPGGDGGGRGLCRM